MRKGDKYNVCLIHDVMTSFRQQYTQVIRAVHISPSVKSAVLQVAPGGGEAAGCYDLITMSAYANDTSQFDCSCAFLILPLHSFLSFLSDDVHRLQLPLSNTELWLDFDTNIDFGPMQFWV